MVIIRLVRVMNWRFSLNGMDWLEGGVRGNQAEEKNRNKCGTYKLWSAPIHGKIKHFVWKLYHNRKCYMVKIHLTISFKSFLTYILSI